MSEISDIIDSATFADDWVTHGWARGPEGKWIELGQSASVTCDSPPAPPELTIHQVAAKLNFLIRFLGFREEEIEWLQAELKKCRAVNDVGADI